MNIKLWAKIGIILGSIMVGTFCLFLLLPFILNFAIDKYTPQIVGEINKLTGLSAGLEDVKIVTTPKMTAGLKVGKFELYTPLKEPVLVSDNFQVKMSLLPILSKNIRADVIRLDSAEITLKINKNGELEVLQYLPQEDENSPKESQDIPNNEQAGLPFGLKLSNHMPDIHIGSYKLTITDGTDNYVLTGGKTDITDFIVNKSVKIKTDGNFALKNREQFKYDIKLFNKIMPEADINELIFASEDKDKEKQKTDEAIDIMAILKGLYDHNVTANAIVDLKTSRDSIDGKVNLNNISIIDITPSNADLSFKGNSIDFLSNIYTAKNEVSTLNGTFKSGKKPFVDMKVKSDVEIANVLNIVKKVALIFNIKDLQTLSANGKLNADFNVKSDLKTVKSTGYLKVPAAKLYYGTYKIGVDNINADVNLNNNNININNIGFSVFNQPLKLFGTITEDAVGDLHLTANKLDLKGLLIALGQASLMKENPVYSGNVSMDVAIKGKLDSIKPVAKVYVNNVDIKNTPSDIRVKAPTTEVNIVSDGKTFSGTAKSTNIALINPALTVSVPVVNANIKEDVIEIKESPVKIENINSKVSGKITNYMTEKIGLDFVTTGDIQSTLKGDMNVAKQTLNLVYSTTNTSTIVIPLFDKSKMMFAGKININGNMANPIVSGNVSVPSISIPEIPVTMTNMNLKLHGTILHGSGTVEEFTSGGIKAENCSSDFELKGNDFYLNNLKGSAFDGKINGNIIYNLANAKTSVDFQGSGMNAEKAIEGAAGIKKALTGTLAFNTKLKLTVADYSDMMKSMTGNLDFTVKSGAFGSIGKFENLLNASNIISNSILKNTVASLTKATVFATTGSFDTIEGNMTFSDGWANLNPVKSAGKSLCYYVTGKYNLINGMTNVNVLGRLEGNVVSKLGVVGELSASKLISYIPKFGATTANILSQLTANPNSEEISKIPALTSKSETYKDFKVIFNGPLTSAGSIKSFKWLSNPDLSEMEKKNIKETVADIKSSLNTDVKTTVENVNTKINENKQMIKDTKESLKNTAQEYKNLFNSLKNIKSETTESSAAKSSVETVQEKPVSTQTTTQTSAPAQTTSTTVQQTQPAAAPAPEKATPAAAESSDATSTSSAEGAE